MKVVNVCLAGSYNDGWGYQDNLLSKYQKINGNDVALITSRFINDKNSEDYLETNSGVYYDNGVKVIRLEHGLGKTLTKLFRHYRGLYSTLENENPDFIFVHCLQFVDIIFVCKYLKKHPNVKCAVDGHADYSNSAQTTFAKFIHKTLWKFCAIKINKYAKKFYGVLPLRCDFMHDMYGIPREKIELLVMGADDELLYKGENLRATTRNDLGISENDFLIITGGKIDYHKKETMLLMDEINKRNGKIKLLIFGSVADGIKSEFDSKLSNYINYIGWQSQEDIYKYICAADFGFFPGRHSVIWEQMVAAGIPCAFKEIKNTQHVNIGGNCLFLKESSNKEISCVLDYILDGNNYSIMRKNANSSKKNQFFYSEIAKKSLK